MSAQRPSADAVALSAREVSLWYGQRQVLDAVSLDVAAACITAVVGRSGSGKSSLLRCFNRLNDEIDGARVQGVVQVGDLGAYARGTSLSELRRRVGMVFQRPNPFPMSVHDNVGYGLRLFGLRRGAELDDRIEAALRAAGLWDEVASRLDDSALDLSFGQQQRLVIARAIAVEPEVLLLDEPTSAFDLAAMLRFEELLLQLASRFAIVLVTHNMQQAARVSHWLAYLHEGRILEFGDTDEIFTNPHRRETEDFITGRAGNRE